MRSVKGQKWGTDKKSLYNIYQSLIKSKLNYRSMVYNTASDSVLEKLQKLQNKALRVILSCPKYTPLIPLIAESGELPLYLQRELNMLKYWTRSIGHDTNLPINEKIEEDPVFTLNPKKVKSVICVSFLRIHFGFRYYLLIKSKNILGHI